MLLSFAFCHGPLAAGDVSVAVAANFRDAALEMGREFTAATGHTAIFSHGSTGQLFAQIVQGAPFDVFLSADRDRARRAVEAGVGVAGSRITYAVGRIVLFSLDKELTRGPDVLRSTRFGRLAIAEPRIAPYGKAAIEALESLGALERLNGTMVRGQSVAQAYQFVRSGNADLGLVSLAQVKRGSAGGFWLVPEDLHRPIRQDAVLLERGVRKHAALDFMAFLKGPRAADVLVRYGYGLAR